MKRVVILSSALAACGGSVEPIVSDETQPLGAQGYYICDANQLCLTRQGETNGSLVIAAQFSQTASQLWTQVNNCSGKYCFPIQWASPSTGRRIGLTTGGQFEMTSLPGVWQSFRPMTDVVFRADNLGSCMGENGLQQAISWRNCGVGAQVNWTFINAPILLVNELGASPSGTTLYSEYQQNGAVGTSATFVNGSDNCMYAAQGTTCTWTGNTISGWQGDWDLNPDNGSALLGADINGRVTTYWDSISTTFKTTVQNSELAGERIYPGTTHAALFLTAPCCGLTEHLVEGSETANMTVTQGDPGGFGGNHVFAVPGVGN